MTCARIWGRGLYVQYDDGEDRGGGQNQRFSATSVLSRGTNTRSI